MRITTLDGLRGVFSLMIVFYHYRSRYLMEDFYDFFIIRESWIFVEFFFVLSGFVISYNYHRLGSTQLKTYVLKRFCRLYPLLFYTTILYLFFEIISNFYFSNYQNSTESISSLLYKSFDTLFFTNSVPLFGYGIGMNGPSWSISSEMISYLIFGLVTVFFSRNNQIIIYFLFVLSISLLLFDPFIYNEYRFLRGLLSFSLGVIIHRTHLKVSHIPNYMECIVLILVVVVMYCIYSTADTLEKFHKIISNNIVFCLSVLTLIKTKGYISKFLNLKIIQYLGKISFSIYLNHLIVIKLLPGMCFDVLGLPKNEMNIILVLFVSISVTILYSSLTHRFIEIHVGKQLRRRLLKNT